MGRKKQRQKPHLQHRQEGHPAERNTKQNQEPHPFIYDPAFEWLTGLEEVNYHTLAEFRVEKQKELDELFTQVLAALSQEGLITLETVMQDGTKIKALASTRSYQREGTIQGHLERARQRVAEMGDPRNEESNPKAKQAQARARREQQERLESALVELSKLQENKKGEQAKSKARVSTSDPQARVMHHSDGGLALSYNAQISTDAAHGLVVGVAVTQAAEDSAQLLPAVDRVEQRLKKKPQRMVADGSYTTRENIEKMAGREIDFVGSMGREEMPSGATAPNRLPPSAFLYQPETNRYLCPEGKLLRPQGRFNRTNKRGFVAYRYEAKISDCAPCIREPECCPENESHGRGLLRRVENIAILAFREKMASRVHRKDGAPDGGKAGDRFFVPDCGSQNDTWAGSGSCYLSRCTSCGREGWNADGHIFGAAGVGAAVADPFALAGQDCLARIYVECCGVSFDAKDAAQHHRVFIELGSLAWFDPAGRTLHARDAHGFRGGIDASYVLGNFLGFVSRCRNDRWLRN